VKWEHPILRHFLAARGVSEDCSIWLQDEFMAVSTFELSIFTGVNQDRRQALQFISSWILSKLSTMPHTRVILNLGLPLANKILFPKSPKGEHF
jgi:hypothetical protein